MGLAATKQEAFWEACGFGNKEKVRRFISEGINVNWVSYTHNSCPIHVASQGKKEIVQMLLDAKCKVDARDDRENTALHHAAMKGHADIAQLLIDYGADVNAQDKNGWTPLINAGYYCQPEVAKVLLRNNATFDTQNKDSRTALHETCRSQSEEESDLYELAKILIEAGSDINSKSSDVGEADFTPLMFCAYHGHPMVAQALIAAGCDLNAQGSNQWTALHWAADRNQLNVAEVLLAAGLDPLIRGRRGELARDRARDNQLRDVLGSAVVGASERREEHYNAHPEARPQTNEAKLQRMNNSIVATAEDHRVLVEQLETRDRELKTQSTGHFPSNAKSNGSALLNATTPPSTARRAPSITVADAASRQSSVDSNDDDDDDNDEEDKDGNDVDPESTQRKNAVSRHENGDRARILINGLVDGGKTRETEKEALVNGLTSKIMATVVE